MDRKKKTDNRRSWSKLLRVLVAGGVALAGVAGARADEKPPPAGDKPAAPAEKSGDAKANEKAKEQEKKKAEAEKEKQKKKAEEEKKAAEGGGVKGW